MDALALKKSQYAEINASGLFVGLPDGVMGNSEVGHLTMGSGRELFTDLVRINMAIEDGSFEKNERLLEAFKAAKDGKKKFHLLGLMSDGGVHSHMDHLFKILRCAKEFGVENTFVHAFMDGRDTPPDSGHTYIKQLLDELERIKYGKLSTVIGRYFAMDRDKRWERIEKAYNLLVSGEGKQIQSDPNEVIQILKENYENKNFDEMMEAINVLPKNEGKIEDGDVLLFFDFRSDRMREIVQTFAFEPKFKAKIPVKDLKVFQMTEYSSEFKLPTLFKPIYVKNSLAEWISSKGLRQFHAAETEKYAHVTFFFNGRCEKNFDKEDRKLIPSPSVESYDMQPSMSMPQVADAVAEAMGTGYDFIMCNFAPPDMVGHTGNFKATVEACTATDQCIGRCMEAAKENGYVMVVTSDHGNAEEMLDGEGKPKTSHNSNLVPLAVISPPGVGPFSIKGSEKSSLKDVAPTICGIMGISSPDEFKGVSLLV